MGSALVSNILPCSYIYMSMLVVKHRVTRRPENSVKKLSTVVCPYAAHSQMSVSKKGTNSPTKTGSSLKKQASWDSFWDVFGMFPSSEQPQCLTWFDDIPKGGCKNSQVVTGCHIMPVPWSSYMGKYGDPLKNNSLLAAFKASSLISLRKRQSITKISRSIRIILSIYRSTCIYIHIYICIWGNL